MNITEDQKSFWFLIFKASLPFELIGTAAAAAEADIDLPMTAAGGKPRLGRQCNAACQLPYGEYYYCGVRLRSRFSRRTRRRSI
jgi:hypothetical protein